MDNNEDKIFVICPKDSIVKAELEGAYNSKFELKTKMGYYTFDKEDNENDMPNEN